MTELPRIRVLLPHVGLDTAQHVVGALDMRWLGMGPLVKEFEERLWRYMEEYNQEKAHPYRWTYTGEPLVRGTPFCQTHCPLHNNIPDWLRMTAEGRLEEAYQLSQETKFVVAVTRHGLCVLPTMSLDRQTRRAPAPP